MSSHSNRKWPVHDAKARFSELLEATLDDGPQIVTKRGIDAAVLVPIATWRQVGATVHMLKDLLLADDARAVLPVPPRGARHRRQPRASA